jgi:hypothetical protein
MVVKHVITLLALPAELLYDVSDYIMDIPRLRRCP